MDSRLFVCGCNFILFLRMIVEVKRYEEWSGNRCDDVNGFSIRKYVEKFQKVSLYK